MINRDKIQQAVFSLIEAIGDDPNREGLRETPRRIADMCAEIFSGIDKDPQEELTTSFDEGYQEMIIVKNIPFYSMCEHHLLPFYGVAHIGYIPNKNGRVIGISKLARLVEIVARRPQLQERLTSQVANILTETLQAEGVAVVIEAEHLCMTIRGVKKPGTKIITSANRGAFRKRLSTRAEFLSLVQQKE